MKIQTPDLKRLNFEENHKSLPFIRCEVWWIIFNYMLEGYADIEPECQN